MRRISRHPPTTADTALTVTERGSSSGMAMGTGVRRSRRASSSVAFDKDPGRFFVVLSLLFALADLYSWSLPPSSSLIVGASGCRYGTLSCVNPSSCWNGGNESVPSDCKCCVGYPYHPRGECRRWEGIDCMVFTGYLKELGRDFQGLPEESGLLRRGATEQNVSRDLHQW